jgi:hypothetical protein
LIVLAGRDIFDALFHPEGRATLARGVMRGLWRAMRPLRTRTSQAAPIAGPLALISVIFLWVVLLATGWALIFWPQLPEEFRSVDGRPVGDGFLDALHLSLVTLTTLGFNEVPEEGWLRVAAPVEALIGFGLLSASISWLLLIYPVLSRRRSLSYEVSLVRQAERETGISVEQLPPEAVERLYADLTSRLVTVERDLVNFPVAYYFSEADERFSLAAVAPYLLELADRGLGEDMPAEVRLRAGMLRDALEDLAVTTARRFHGSPGPVEAVLRAYARDHVRPAD